MTEQVIDVTALMDHLEVMIRIADRLAEKTPYPPGIKKVRDAAEQEVSRARRIMER